MPDRAGCVKKLFCSVRPVTVEVHFLDPIPYEEYQGMKTTEIGEMVKKRIEAVVTA